VPIPLLGPVLLCAAIEALLLAGDAGYLADEGLRRRVYGYTAFWPRLLTGEVPALYPGQTAVMFVTYGLVHGGPLHLAMNMLALWSLGRAVLLRAGRRSFWLILGAALPGGAGGYAALASTAQPMIGASGALFGLAGALAAWAARDAGGAWRGLWLTLRIAAVLALLNLALWWALSGGLAWQTHLGGFLAGWLAAALPARWTGLRGGA
jgi:rhomboid protease GluP